MSNEHPKELITALRNLRKKHGASAFDATIKALVDGDLTLAPGSRGRPGLSELDKQLFAYAMVQARIEVDGMTPKEAAKDAAALGHNFSFPDVGAGDVVVYRHPTMTSWQSILKSYNEAKKAREESQAARDALDPLLQHFIAVRLHERQSKQ